MHLFCVVIGILYLWCDFGLGIDNDQILLNDTGLLKDALRCISRVTW